MKYFLTVSAATLFLSVPAMAELSGHDIMMKNDDVRKIDSVVTEVKMSSGDKGSEKVKDFTWWRKIDSDRIHYSTLTRFHFPPEVKGEGILFLESSGDKADIQLYLPTFKKVRRVESSQQHGSFMGSEFSYSDIATPHADDFKDKLQKEESCPGEKTVRCWVVESTPANDGVRERIGISLGTAWVREDNNMVDHAEYKDLDGTLWKKLDMTEVKEVDTRNHKWMALHLKMENVKTHRSTTLIFSDVKVDKVIPDSTFTVQNLSRDQ